MNAKKTLSMTLAAAMAAGLLAGCGGSSSTAASSTSTSTESKAESTAASTEATTDAAGKVYYLNFKPEQDEAWQNLAKKYTEETGVPVTVVTAASGQYETTLMSEMAKSDAPTLFQVNGPVGLANWKDYCYDLSGTKIAGDLTSDTYALKDGDQMLGIGYVIESYGLITNKTLLEKAGYSVDDIKSFDDLKKVAEDITARKDELGFSAFTSAGMDGSSDWRYKTHLANLPIYFEYQEDGIDNTDAIKGTYLDNYKNIFDLYINNSTCDPTELAGKTGDDSRNEFLNDEAVFFQNGSWEYTNLVGDGKPFTDDDLTMLPIYIGVGDEANQGLCTGTENYWCVNGTAELADAIQTVKGQNIYLVAVVSTCVDTLMAERYDATALQTASGSAYTDSSGGWVDPYNTFIRTYLVSLCKELHDLGFDEVAFSYLQQPLSDTEVKYASQSGTPSRTDAVVSLTKYLRANLTATGLRVSAVVSADSILQSRAAQSGQDMAVFPKLFDRVFVFASADNVATLQSAIAADSSFDAATRFVPFLAKAPESGSYVTTG